MCEPKFKVGDKAEFNPVGDTWIPVSIESQALQWVSPHCGPGHLYLVEYTHVHLAHSDYLRPVEQWKRCPGRHRVHAQGASPGQSIYSNMERRAD